ncbi:FOG: TPR repeat, SEL1 subfamily, partial [hydrothermal vent metagenome]
MTRSRNMLNLMIAATALGFSVPSFADIKAGVDAWGRGDYKTAIGEWRGPATNGDADAQFNLAQAYKLGRGVPMDLKQAESWYKKAADQGHLQASDNYGLILFQNNRRSEALPYLQTSASRGEPRAQYVLGTGHFNGDFVEKDWIKAYALMTRASAKGLPQATSNIGQMDKYIPINDRRRAVELAGQMEQQEKRVRTAQVGGLRPAQPTGPVQTAQLPPSRAVSPQPAPAPVSVPGASYTLPSSPPPTAAPTRIPAPVRASSGGKWRVQLGAFSDSNKAKNLWSNLEDRVSGLRNLQPYLVKAGSI